VVGAREVSMLASVGVSVTRNADADPEEMLREADAAMYRAKGSGRHQPELFDDTMRREITASLEIEQRLLNALPRRELVLTYQPILQLAGGRAVGCEALVRWLPDGTQEPTMDALLPSSFLARAGDSELIVQIGDWVLHTACAQAAAWSAAGVSIPISVNIAARQLNGPDLAQRVKLQLERFNLPGRALCLEVSEDAVLRDPGRARAALIELKRLGVAIALDNFGAGASSLSLPGNLPLDMLKLDRRLIQSFTRDREARAMVVAIIALAREARVTPVAVGIETKQQLALALELSCEVGQGFLLHRPDAPERLSFTGGPVTVTSAPWRPRVRLGSNGRRG
jgi:EAL domain-containing protein (putative c-di-GMP-specific phosphodiesterase class I)